MTSLTSIIKFAVAVASILWKSWAWIHVLTRAKWLSWLSVLKKFRNLFSGCFCGSQTVLLRQHVGCAIDFQWSRTSGGFKAFDVPWTCRPSCKLLGSRLLWLQASSGEGRIWREYSKIGNFFRSDVLILAFVETASGKCIKKDSHWTSTNLEKCWKVRRFRAAICQGSPLTRAIETGLLASPPGHHVVTALASEHLEASCDIGRPRDWKCGNLIDPFWLWRSNLQSVSKCPFLAATGDDWCHCVTVDQCSPILPFRGQPRSYVQLFRQWTSEIYQRLVSEIWHWLVVGGVIWVPIWPKIPTKKNILLQSMLLVVWWKWNCYKSVWICRMTLFRLTWHWAFWAFQPTLQVWWYVPEECRQDITVEESRRLFAKEGAAS